MADVTSPWATLRFRRSKDVKGWALLGIPQRRYPEVMQPLFERQARFIEKHGRGEFVNVLFEAPVALAARLALAFPAPPSCEPLVVNQAGTRLLYGKFAMSPKARPQARETEDRPGLKLLSGQEEFWQVVTTLSDVTALPLERLSPSARGPESSANRVGGRKKKVATSGKQSNGSTPENVAVQALAQAGIRLQPASALTPPQRAGDFCSGNLPGESVGLDEEGFEVDEWRGEQEAALPASEDFEDVWDTEELDDFGLGTDLGINASSDDFSEVLRSECTASDTSPVGAASLDVEMSREEMMRQDAQQSPSLMSETMSSETVAQPRLPDRPSEMESMHSVEVTSTNAPALDQPVLGQPALGHYGSGLLPQPSDAATLQAYHSSGLTVADAIALAQQQDAAAWAEQRQQRRIQLPFELTPVPELPIPALAGTTGADEQQVYILSQGVACWNDWRRANPHIRPNLRGAYLNNLDLAGVDLHDVDLCFAFLFRADLRQADLSLAWLWGADLIRADLGGASLWGAALGGAYLNHANLAGADLTHADMRGAYWHGAIWDGALLPNGCWFEDCQFEEDWGWGY